MRTTLTLDDALLGQAQALTGLIEPNQLIREALEALIERQIRLGRGDVRNSLSNAWTAEAHRQSLSVALSERAIQDQEFIDAVSEQPGA